MRERLLITGVAGFIGRAVAAEAVRQGYRVTGVDRRHAALDGVDVVQGDIRDGDRLRQVVRGQDHVIHLAAITSNVAFLQDPGEGYDVNVNGFLTVIEAAARQGCQRFIYASSAAVYLDRFAEDTVIDIRDQSNHYAKSKLMNEMVARSYEHVYGLRTIGLRYFNVYGTGENAKGDYASIITLFLKARQRREALVVYGDGRQARDLIHVRDAARITVDLLDNASHDVYNVGTGVATTYTAIAEMIDRHHVRYVPNPLPSYQHFTQAETTRLREALGTYPFVGLADGIATVSVEPAEPAEARRADSIGV